MKTSFLAAFAVATLAAAVSFLCIGQRSPEPPVTPMVDGEGTRLLGRLPIAFVPNLGQWAGSAQYVARLGAITVFLEERGWTFTLAQREKAKASERAVAVRMTFAGASAPTLVAEEQLPGRHNYFLGCDPSRWRSDVPLYASVRYRNLQPGVDVRTREHDGRFEYDLLLQPGADLDAVEIAVEGIERMHVDTDGALVFETGVGPVRMPAPVSWEESPSGETSPITCRHVLRDANRFGFEAPDRQPGWALVVDPGLVWSTFVGGAGYDFALALALDAQGTATIAGQTSSSDFPTTPGAFDQSYGGGTSQGGDVFVTRLAPTGASLVYSTYLGGTGNETARAIALDAQGAATVAGQTWSSDFPTTPGAFDQSLNGLSDVFVARLSPTGTNLIWSTFLGGEYDDRAYGLAVDAQGAATVVGQTASSNFPTTVGAFDTTYNGGTFYNGDAFVARLVPTGASLVYSTFLGGTSDDAAYAVAVDAQGAAAVAGGTEAADFPTTPGAFDQNFDGPRDAFVSKLSPSGASLVWSTFLGGTVNDQAFALALDGQGAATVAGHTSSSDFPTTVGAFDRTYNGGMVYQGDAFVARLSPTGASLVYSTFLGGTTNDRVFALALDGQGVATVAGFTDSADFPTTLGAFDTTYNGPSPDGGDAFVARLSSTFSTLLYSTFLGGASYETAWAMALDARGEAIVAGNTWSVDFTITPGAFDTSFNGGVDAFVTRLDMRPTGVASFGRSSPGCAGPLAISATSMPRVGNTGFALTCGNAPPNTTGLLALTAQALASPFVVLGVEVWVDPTLAFVQLAANSNLVGACEVPLPIASVPSLGGVRLFAQFFWAGPTAPPPCPPLGLSASHALDITVQP